MNWEMQFSRALSSAMCEALACYTMLYNLDQHGKNTWAACVKVMLKHFD